MADSGADPTDIAEMSASASSTRPLDLGASRAGSWSDLPATFGDYQIIERIAEGGMGVVFKAHDVALDRLVAIKIIRDFGSPHDDRMNRLFREARISASLKHPSIAQIYNIGQVNGLPYIVSEFVKGTSFSEYARPHGRLAPTDLAGIIARVADALHYAHSLGIIHRDVKPSNILIDEELCPHLIDFGLARSWADSAEATLSHVGQILGTPSYMSPEQVEPRLDAIGPATDVYSLGATLYTLLAGQPPFPGPDALEAMLLVRTAEPVPPRRLNPKVPPDLETICLKAMAKDPRKRYATVRDMADDLRRFQRGIPITARAQAHASVQFVCFADIGGCSPRPCSPSRARHRCVFSSGRDSLRQDRAPLRGCIRWSPPMQRTAGCCVSPSIVRPRQSFDGPCRWAMQPFAHSPAGMTACNRSPERTIGSVTFS